MSKESNTIQPMKLKELESISGYTFKDPGILLLAMTHSSFANEKKAAGSTSNERLEFLGDAVLNIITSEYLYRLDPMLPEGQMTKTRASLVCESSLMKCANGIGLGAFLLLGKGEENSGGRSRSSILSDAFEALIGAIYLDGGLEQARRFIMFAMNDLFKDLSSRDGFVDYKTQFQEIIQKTGEQKISYTILNEKGPDHNKSFLVQLLVGDQPMGTGEGRTKKEAEQVAAKSALEKLRMG